MKNSEHLKTLETQTCLRTKRNPIESLFEMKWHGKNYLKSHRHKQSYHLRRSSLPKLDKPTRSLVGLMLVILIFYTLGKIYFFAPIQGNFILRN